MSENNLNVGQINAGAMQVGSSNVMYLPAQQETAGQQEAARRPAGWDVGVITVLSEETSAVTATLATAGSCQAQVHGSGLRFHEARLDVAGADIRVVVTQALGQGQRPAIIAFERLREIYAPATVVLTGIAGAIHPSLSPGDVVVVDSVVYYEGRRETAAGIYRRGQASQVPARTKYAINAFFADHGEPYAATACGRDGRVRTFSAMPGPIGSGEAVLMDENSAIRKYVSAFNEKTLAVETEAAGVAEAFYETVDTLSAGTGWLAIRGISDRADAAKGYSYHQVASWHAAAILLEMLPYLRVSPLA